MATETNSDSPQEQLWVVCPICDQPNPAGTLHCKHCWGASLGKEKPLTSEELADETRRRQKIKKRRKFIRIFVFAGLLPLILIGGSIWYLYSFTDVIFSPRIEINSNSPPGDWAMARHDLNRSGTADSSIIQPQGKLKWSFQTGAEIGGSPALANGMVYFGSADSKLYALDAITGEKRWEFQTGSFVLSSPAVVDETVYFGSNDGTFYALDAVTGHKIWTYQTRYAIRSSPTVANGMVYFGGDDSNLYALDSKTGNLLWKFNAKNYIEASPVVSSGIIYFGSNDGFCYAINASDGRFRLSFKMYQAVLSPPATCDGIAYLTNKGSLFAIDGSARNWPWEHDLRPWWLQFWAFHLAPNPPPISGYVWQVRLVTDPYASNPKGVKVSNNAPIVAEDTIYATGDNLLYSIAKDTKEFRWVFEAGEKIESSPALANNVLYFGCNDRRLYAVETKTGTKLWDFTSGGRIKTSPVLANGVIYFGCEDGKLYAIE